MRTMHLFAGGGGGMYADLILGHTPTVAVEWDAYACEVLRARKADGWWQECEIIEQDIRTFSGERYAGEVDCIHAGFPCQDLSVAGPQAGLDGNRSSLYREAIRIFREVRPRYLFLENVPGIFTANGGEAFNRVMSDLAALGLNARWVPVSAADVGAMYEGERWWCLAQDMRQGLQERNERSGTRPPALTHQGGQPLRVPTEKERPSWWDVEPPVVRMVRGLAQRVYQRPRRIRMLGNGQVPLQAAYAWVMLGGPVNY